MDKYRDFYRENDNNNILLFVNGEKQNFQFGSNTTAGPDKNLTLNGIREFLLRFCCTNCCSNLWYGTANCCTSTANSCTATAINCGILCCGVILLLGLTPYVLIFFLIFSKKKDLARWSLHVIYETASLSSDLPPLLRSAPQVATAI